VRKRSHPCTHRHIIHADLKPENILLDFESLDASRIDTAKTKIADFGLSRIQHETTLLARISAKGKQGTPLYMDPALYNDVTAISRTSDIYSFGILAWQLITGQTPFEDVLKRIGTVRSFEDAVRAGARPPVSALVPLLPAGVVEDVTTLLEACWDGDRGRRPIAERITAVLQGVLDRWEDAIVRSAVALAMTQSEAIYLTTTHAREVVHASTVLKGHPGESVFSYRVTALAMLPDGRLASGSTDKTIILCNIHTGICEATLEGHTEQVKGFFHLPDGRLGSYSCDGTIRAWNVADGTHEVIRSDMCNIQSVVILPDDRYAAACYYGDGDKRNRDICVWRGKDEPFAFFKGHSDRVYWLAELPDGNFASCSYDFTIRIWAPDTGKCIRVIYVNMRVDHLVMLTDGRLACGNLYSSHQVLVVNVITGACEVLELDGNGDFDFVTSLVALPRGRLACGSRKGCKVWNTTTGEVEVFITAPYASYARALCLLPDGRLASGGLDNRVRLWSL
jgi:hypothetical protein